MENKVISTSRRKILKQLGLLGLASCMPISIIADKQKMNQRKIPSTGELLPLVGLGTWQTFDVGNTHAEREPLREVLKTLVQLRGQLVDSSPMYGRSEQVVGDLAQDLDLHTKLFKATKVWTNGREAGKTQMMQSMQRMRATKIDLMQIHNLVDWRTHIKTLRAWKEEGKLTYIGITHYTEGAYSTIKQVLKQEQVDFLQINYSMLSRLAAEELFPLAQEKGVGVIVNRPYEGGSLFRKVSGKALPNWASEFDCNSWGQFFLKYILAHPAVNCVIPGTSKAKHMKDNALAGYGRLPNAKQQKEMLAFLKTI